jgi:RNA ligase (TIGR02306 family)
LSQGLLLPITVLGQQELPLTEGSDVTELLGIQKYEPPIPAQLAGEVRGMFPSVVRKTDQERIQNLVNELAEWHKSDATWELTEKLDGTSCTFYLDVHNDFHACSRNLDLRYNPDVTYWKIADRYDIRTKMESREMRGLAIQGEVIGEGIQGNHYNFKGQDFFVFDIYDTLYGSYLSPEHRRRVVQELGLNHVPVVSYDHDLKGAFDVATVLSWAEDKSRLNNNVEREGLVFKRNDGGASFKSISNRWLLKTGG